MKAIIRITKECTHVNYFGFEIQKCIQSNGNCFGNGDLRIVALIVSSRSNFDSHLTIKLGSLINQICHVCAVFGDLDDTNNLTL